MTRERKLRWVRSTFVPHTLEGEPLDEVPCYAFGELVVHKSGSGKGWHVSHEPTAWGVAVGPRALPTKAAAQRCAEDLYPILDWSADLEDLQREISGPKGRKAYEIMRLQLLFA